MLRPFDNISDKVSAIIQSLKIYWTDPDHSDILELVKQDSLLGQAIYLLARKSARFDDTRMEFEIDEKEIPVVFGDLMRLYTVAGYER